MLCTLATGPASCGIAIYAGVEEDDFVYLGDDLMYPGGARVGVERRNLSPFIRSHLHVIDKILVKKSKPLLYSRQFNLSVLKGLRGYLIKNQEVRYLKIEQVMTTKI